MELAADPPAHQATLDLPAAVGLDDERGGLRGDADLRERRLDGTDQPTRLLSDRVQAIRRDAERIEVMS